MSGISGFAWIVVGILVGGISGYIGFIFETEKPFFFKLNTFVGIIMLLYGIIKLKLEQASRKKDFEQKKHEILNKRRDRFDDIDMSPEEYQKRMIQQRQQSRQHVVNQNPHMQRQHSQQGQTHANQQYQNHQANSQHHTQQHYPQGHHRHQTHHGQQQSHTNPSQQQQHYRHTHHQQVQEKGLIGKINSRFGVKRGGYCSQCGSPLLKNHKFCPMCGART